MQNDYSSYTNSTKINVISVCVCVLKNALVGPTSPECGEQNFDVCLFNNTLLDPETKKKRNKIIRPDNPTC